jgi:hypothetical protein
VLKEGGGALTGCERGTPWRAMERRDALTGCEGLGLTINTSLDPKIPITIPSSTISKEEIPRIRFHISLQIPLVILINCPSDRRPRALANKYTFHIVSFQDLTRGRIDNFKLVAEERESC